MPRFNNQCDRVDRISLIITTRNESVRLSKTIDSLLANTFFPDFEVLILDDASTDGSCDFLQWPRYIDDERLKYVRSDVQKGYNALRIHGAELASGSVLQFLDAHHSFSPYWLTNLYDRLRRHDFRALVGPAISRLDPDTWLPHDTCTYGWTFDEALYPGSPITRDRVGPGGRVVALVGAQLMIDREIYQRIGGHWPLFQGHNTEDVDICLRAFLLGFDCYVEPAALIGHYYKTSYMNPVTHGQLLFNTFALAYLNFGMEKYEEIKARNGGQTGYDEAMTLMDRLRPDVEQFREWIERHQIRSGADLLDSFSGGHSQISEPLADNGESPSRIEPRVSIVIAARQEAENVRRTVDSILPTIDDSDVEIVLVDDGSTDDSFAFLSEEPYDSDRRLRRFRFQVPVGCIRARHKGASLARGDYLVFFDAHMALPAGWLGGLIGAVETWGPDSVVTPDVAPLDPDTWTPTQANGMVLNLDDELDFRWTKPPYSTGLLPTVGGCCAAMRRDLYVRTGGFDLGLRGWGCEFVELILKVYEAGGACYREPSVVVGHRFRQTSPYPRTWRDLLYNRLRTGYVHLPVYAFCRLLQRLSTRPAFSEAFAEFQESLIDLEHLRSERRASSVRDSSWFVRLFLPGLAFSARGFADCVAAHLCRSCGAKCASNDLFCNECGERLTSPEMLMEQAGVPGAILCANCHYESGLDDIFCGKCGLRLGPTNKLVVGAPGGS